MAETGAYTGPLPSDFSTASQGSAYDDLFKSEMAKTADTLLRDDIADKKLAEFPLWTSISRSMKLTFFTENDVASIEHLYEAEVCRLMRRLPPSQQQYNTYSMIAQARILFKANIRRSLGVKSGQINERLAFLTIFKMFSGVSSPIESPHAAKRGVLDRVLGR